MVLCIVLKLLELDTKLVMSFWGTVSCDDVFTRQSTKVWAPEPLVHTLILVR